MVLAGLLTAGLVISLTIYAIFTKTDFTMFGGLLVAATFCLIFGSIIGFFLNSR